MSDALEPGAGRDPAPRWRIGAVVSVFALVALLPLVFDVLRDIPPNYGCGDEAPVGQAMRLAAYRAGSVPLHALAAVALATAIVALSVARARRGRTGPVGRPTALAVLVLVLLVLAPEPRQPLVYGPVAVAAGGLALLGAALGPAGGAAAATVLLGAMATHGGRQVSRSGSRVWTSAYCWLGLALVGGHLLVVQLQGDGPLIC